MPWQPNAARRQIETEANREVERERELRFKAIEGRIGEVTDMASGATERARATDVKSPPAALAPQEPAAPVESAEPEPEPEPKPRSTPRRRRSSSKSKADSDDKDPEPASEETQIVPAPGGPVDLSSATFDDLRGLGLSVTQAKRVLDFRERLGGFDSVDDLDYVPGLPKSLLVELKDQVTV